MAAEFKPKDADQPTPLAPPRTPAEFPVDVLPEWCRTFVKELAHATQTPVDLAGCCVLGVLATAAGGRVRVQIRRGWIEPTNLYLLPVLPPGSRKSSVVDAATTPVLETEEALVEAVKATRSETEVLRGIAENAATKAMRDAANAAPEKRAEASANAVSAMAAVDSLVVPPIPRLLADDITPEAVGSLLAEQGGRLSIISAEGGIFDIIGGRYTGGIPALDTWLKGHAGDALRVDRKGRASEYVKRPALTMLLTVQPSVMQDIARNGAFRGRGLPARFLYAIPADNMGNREVGTEPVSEDAERTYNAKARALITELAEWTDPAVVVMSKDANAAMLQFERELEPRLRLEGDLGSLRDWAAKLAGATARIAALLHVASAPPSEWYRTEVGADHVRNAIRIATYFIEHAKAAFGLLADTELSNAAYLLDHIQKQTADEFSISGLMRDLPRGRFPTAAAVTEATTSLVENGWLIPVPPPKRTGPGRPPSPSFRRRDADPAGAEPEVLRGAA